MKDFLRDYFCANESDGLNDDAKHVNEDNKRENSDEYTLQGGDLRMIPGGRYGCT